MQIVFLQPLQMRTSIVIAIVLFACTCNRGRSEVISKRNKPELPPSASLKVHTSEISSSLHDPEVKHPETRNGHQQHIAKVFEFERSPKQNMCSVTSKECGAFNCEPGKVYSPLYEGGTCVCPQTTYYAFLDSILSTMNLTTFPVGLTPDQANFVYTLLQEGILVITPNMTVSFQAIRPGFVWDVVACTFVQICPDGFTLSPTSQLCVCDSSINCAAKCRNELNHYDGLDHSSFLEKYKDCDDLVLDPTTCRCVKSCPDNVQCERGFHLDHQCQCVSNACNYNLQCINGQHFDSNICQCVNGQICSDCDMPCPLGFVYDNIQCGCVLPVRPMGTRIDFSTGTCVN